MAVAINGLYIDDGGQLKLLLRDAARCKSLACCVIITGVNAADYPLPQTPLAPRSSPTPPSFSDSPKLASHSVFKPRAFLSTKHAATTRCRSQHRVVGNRSGPSRRRLRVSHVGPWFPTTGTPRITASGQYLGFDGPQGPQVPGQLIVVLNDPALFLPLLGKGSKELNKSAKYLAANQECLAQDFDP
eukprot:gene12934-5970_t